MKTPLLAAALLLALLLAASGHAAPVFYTGTGDWNVAANWGGTLPVSGDVAVINSGSTVSFTAGDTYTLGTGGFSMGSNTLATTATLNITGGTLTAGNSFVGRSSNLSKAVLTLSGGSLVLAGSAVLNVGNNIYSPNTFVGNTASATFSGGTFQGGLAIGNSTSANQTGSLTVQGTGAAISGLSTQGLAINATGTLSFVLDSSGVSLLNYAADTAAGAISFATGGALTLDASAFSSYGSISTIHLINYANASSVSGFSNLALSVTGLQSGYSGTIVNNAATDSINLVIAAVPEPAPAAFLLGTGLLGGMLGVRRWARPFLRA